MSPTISRLSRRTILRGLGVAISLPWLEAMSRTSVLAASAAKPPMRLGFFFVPNGMHMEHFKPKQEGADFELGPILKPLARFKSEMTVITNTALDGGRAKGDGPAHPKKTAGADIKNGQSVDQLAAEKIGKLTKLPSLELGLVPSTPAGGCDSGYSCAYSSNISWRTETSPMAKETQPLAVFDRLFGNQKADQETVSKSKREQLKKSILDFAMADAKDLEGKLGVADKRKLDEYLYAVRDIERRVNTFSKEGETIVPYDRPIGSPRDMTHHMRLMFDLLALAYQTDTTRVATFMLADDGDNRGYPFIGVNEGHHDLSHHGNSAEKHEKISKINQFHVSQYAYFIEKLAATREGDGTLLDNCMLMYGAGLGDGNRHNHDDLPIFLMGKGAGAIKPGRHIANQKEVPLTNLYRYMLNSIGASVDNYSDSTGVMTEVAG
jgi:Protein of unknown function (DUF1552)